jgi:predicted regulator of Ras-like GTPase activity (Roadblock/LC7/MglB family)
MAVQGNLIDISLSSLISINCNEMNQARLLVKHQDQEGSVFFDEGDIVHMTLGSQEGEDVIFELLTWEDGTFELTKDVRAPKRSVQTNWSHLLLEGLRRMDEQALAQDNGDNEVEREQRKAERQAAQRIAKDFTRINGIDGALVTSKYADVLGYETTNNPGATAALAAFIGRRAEELSILLNAGSLKQITISGDNWRMIVFPIEKHYVALSMDPKISVSATADAIQVTKRRHRKEKD